MVFLLIFVINLASAADLTQMTITADNRVIQATSTYKFNFRYPTALTSTSRFRIIFPSVFTGISSGTAACSIQTLQSGCTPTCTFTGNNLLISNCFPPTSNIVTIDVSNIKNPISTTTGSFVINTLNSADTVIDQGSISYT